ncbi:hypothetical protein VNI00_010627 [Paramarasmius palmivorus]|uniref:Uncharacterized protein n=1 Tax=Paramarasmius palmivorus TaxID=297713 RepID=A0AAW0CGU0_9AGAR
MFNILHTVSTVSSLFNGASAQQCLNGGIGSPKPIPPPMEQGKEAQDILREKVLESEVQYSDSELLVDKMVNEEVEFVLVFGKRYVA